MFRDSFKYYKSRNPPANLRDVIDFQNADNAKVKGINGTFENEQETNEFGLSSIKDWKIYELLNIPGLIFIQNPFTADGQRYWITKCLKDYSKKPSKLNLDVHSVLNDDENWWDICFKQDNPNRAKDLLPKLRWATLGYHHNWDTKLYSEDSKTEMPTELSGLTSFLAKALGFNQFKAEAAIINYYRMNSTLAGHTDHSEPNVEAPLFSISFGQTAIFLIGGYTQEEPASAMFLRSGDVVVMSGNSRLRYHGVPKVLPTKNAVWEIDKSSQNISLTYDGNDTNIVKSYICEARININVRQVLKKGQLCIY